MPTINKTAVDRGHQGSTDAAVGFDKRLGELGRNLFGVDRFELIRRTKILKHGAVFLGDRALQLCIDGFSDLRQQFEFPRLVRWNRVVVAAQIGEQPVIFARRTPREGLEALPDRTGVFCAVGRDQESSRQVAIGCVDELFLHALVPVAGLLKRARA